MSSWRTSAEMNIKLHTPKSLKNGSGMASLKQFLLSLFATTVSIAFTFGMATLPMQASAQEMATKGRSADEIVPSGISFVKAEGDLNKDGLKDLVISVGSALAVYFATPSGDYELWKQYNDILPVDEEGDDFMIDIELSITDRGALKIETGSFASSGTSYVTNNNYTYRFQNGDFYKIGEEQHSMSRMTGDDKTVSTNYLTHKRQVVIQNAFDESIKPKETWTSIPKSTLRRLGEDQLD